MRLSGITKKNGISLVDQNSPSMEKDLKSMTMKRFSVTAIFSTINI